jgi:hypothetical protein
MSASSACCFWSSLVISLRHEFNSALFVMPFYQFVDSAQQLPLSLSVVSRCGELGIYCRL